MIIRPGGKVKPKSKTRHDLAGPAAHYTATSDDIWMKNWGEFSYSMQWIDQLFISHHILTRTIAFYTQVSRVHRLNLKCISRNNDQTNSIKPPRVRV